MGGTTSHSTETADLPVCLLLGQQTHDVPAAVLKKDFRLTQHKDTQRSIANYLNAALMQAKLQHSNICAMLELQLQINKDNCSIGQVLETLDSTLARDMETRTQANRAFTETEVRYIAAQTATALAYSHSKDTVHRQIRPSSIFRCERTYKVGGFGCVSTQLLDMQRAKCEDVFALGTSLLCVATGMSSERCEPVTALEQAEQRFSREMQNLLSRMLSEKEDHRPTMQEISSILSPSTLNSAPLAHVTCQGLSFFDLQMNAWKQSVTLRQNIEANNYSSWVVLRDRNVFCCGGGSVVCGYSGRQTYMLGVDGAVNSRAKMNFGRYWHGVLALEAEHSVYVFGSGAPQKGSCKCVRREQQRY